MSQEVVDASSAAEIVFGDMGLVELKGVAGPVHLHTASLPG